MACARRTMAWLRRGRELRSPSGLRPTGVRDLCPSIESDSCRQLETPTSGGPNRSKDLVCVCSLILSYDRASVQVFE